MFQNLLATLESWNAHLQSHALFVISSIVYVNPFVRLFLIRRSCTASIVSSYIYPWLSKNRALSAHGSPCDIQVLFGSRRTISHK